MGSLRRRSVLLTFDAFGTLFHPRKPIASQYAEVAKQLGLKHVNEEELQASFRKAFKGESKRHPNYGKHSGITPPEWWGNIIRAAFIPLLPSRHKLPDRLISELLQRFSGTEGYQLYPDVLPFFRTLHNQRSHHYSKEIWPWTHTIVGIISNSDDRVPLILRNLGLSTGQLSSSNADHSLRSEIVISNDIDFTVLSYDVGVEKPERAIFEAAERIAEGVFSSNPDMEQSFDFIHVGDDMVQDLYGSRQLNSIGVLVDRVGKFKSCFRQTGQVLPLLTEDSSHGKHHYVAVENLNAIFSKTFGAFCTRELQPSKPIS